MFFAAIFTALAGAIIQAYPQAVVLAGILGGITFASFLVAISLAQKNPSAKRFDVIAATAKPSRVKRII